MKWFVTLNTWRLLNYLNKGNYFNKRSRARISCFVLTTRCYIFKSNTSGNGCWKLFIYWNLLWRIEIIQDSHHFSYKYGCCDVPLTPYLISKVLVCTALLQVHSSGQKFRPIIWIILLLDKAFLNDENTWVHDIFIVP